ncbi:MAG: phasin family protein [Pseudomonadota bacterium]|nr:phasin family protein [Pseudomonadota bacterium]
MLFAPEQFTEVNKSNIDAALKFATVSFDAAERLMGLQLAVGRDALQEGVKTAKVLAEVRDVQDLTSLRGKFAETGTEKWTDYSKAVFEVAQHTQAQWSKLFESQLTEMNKNVAVALDKAVKTAPAGADVAIAAIRSTMSASSAAFDSMTKAAKQVASYTDANIKAVTNETNAAVRSVKK